MKTGSMLKLTGLLAAFSLTSMLLAVAPSALAGGPGAADNATNLSQRASDTLATVHQDAETIENSADTLEGYNREAFEIDWRVDARTLGNMKSDINKVDKMVHQLRGMEADLPQAEQSEINQIVPAAAELTNNAQLAIRFLSTHQEGTMLPQYTSYAGEMYAEAARIVQSTAPARS